MSTAMIAFFALSVGIIAGFFTASIFAVAHINDLHEHYRREIAKLRVTYGQD
jgi:hypothetical protein